MPTFILVVMFFASAPLFLLPATIALWVNRPRSTGVVVFNLALLVLFYLNLRSILQSASTQSLPFPLQPGAAVILIAWLILLRQAVTRDRRDVSV